VTQTKLIYDGDCAFCSLCVKLGQKNLKNFPVVVAFQRINPSEFGLTQKQVANSIWLIRAGLPPIPANQAISAMLLAEANPGWRLLGWVTSLPLVRTVFKAFYYWVARNRAKMPGATAACELPDTLK